MAVAEEQPLQGDGAARIYEVKSSSHLGFPVGAWCLATALPRDSCCLKTDVEVEAIDTPTAQQVGRKLVQLAMFGKKSTSCTLEVARHCGVDTSDFERAFPVWRFTSGNNCGLLLIHLAGVCLLSSRIVVSGSGRFASPAAEEGHVNCTEAVRTHILATDIVGAETREDCREWCIEKFGLRRFDVLRMGESLDSKALLCFKVEASHFAAPASLVCITLSFAYLAMSVILGRNQYDSMNKVMPPSLFKFATADTRDTMCCISTTAGRKQVIGIRKKALSMMFDTFTDLLSVWNLMKTGQPFFAFFLLFIVVSSKGNGSVFQSSQVANLLMSAKVGFPTYALLEDVVAEGWEQYASLLITSFVVLRAPLGALDCVSLVTFAGSMAFTSLGLLEVSSCRLVLLRGADQSENIDDFDRRRDLVPSTPRAIVNMLASTAFAFNLVAWAVVFRHQTLLTGFFLFDGVFLVAMVCMLICGLVRKDRSDSVFFSEVAAWASLGVLGLWATLLCAPGGLRLGSARLLPARGDLELPWLPTWDPTSIAMLHFALKCIFLYVFAGLGLLCTFVECFLHLATTPPLGEPRSHGAAGAAGLEEDRLAVDAPEQQ